VRAKWILGGAVILWPLLVWGLTIGQALAEVRITYRLKWLANMSTVGDLYADTSGLFKAQGLVVAVKPGGPERDAIRELELGQADFGVASADQVIRALAKGAPVVVIAQLFQRNPLQWIYYRDRVSIGQLKDLAGKRLGVTFGKNDEFIMRTLLASAHIDADQVQLFSVRLDYTPFYNGAVDLWPVYRNTQGVEIGGRLRAAGEKIAFFDPSRHGVSFVANSVVTSERMLANKPEVVQRFMRALLAGWAQAMDPRNARQAVLTVRRFDQDTTIEVLNAQLAATRQLIVPNGQTPIGAIDHPAWQQTEAIMLAHGQIPRSVDVLRHIKPIVE
jgi:NitT/TauT family transport system substrate-binding protein